MLTNIFITIIIVFSLFFCIDECKLLYVNRKIKKTLKGNTLDTLKSTKLSKLYEDYINTVNISTNNGTKTNISAMELFTDRNICEFYKINFRMLDSASGTLVGLGLGGTFLGLTLGITGFNSTNTEMINDSIQNLLSGMGTAFQTSLWGMGCSIVFTFLDKFIRNRFYRNIYRLTEKFDSMYYIDDVALAKINQQTIIDNLYNSLRNDILEQTNNVVSKLIYSTAEEQNVPIGNAIREILTENMQQSKALKSFSTDLAIELNQGFDETLSRQMQQKIVPLMESVDATTKIVVEHIDKMAEVVAAPATDMMQAVVDDLKQSMKSIIKEFNQGLSGSATSELENLAIQLGTAAQSMADFPENMKHISDTLQVTIEEVKNSISEISKTSANTNSIAMQQMQEQITFATGAISNAITEVKEVMSGISQSSQEQSNQMVNKLADAAEKMGMFLTNTISTLSSSVQSSVNNIADDINSKQAALINLQEDTTTQTKKLLESFNAGLDRLERMNEYIAGTINGFKQAQGEITLSTSNLRSISADMKLATELFNKGQNDYASKLAQLQITSQRGIDQVTEILKDSGQLSKEYAEKFATIKQGLGSIFDQLQKGLTAYSRTVQQTTEQYLSRYTSSLTQTTEALSSTIERQNEITEILTETITRNKK